MAKKKPMKKAEKKAYHQGFNDGFDARAAVEKIEESLEQKHLDEQDVDEDSKEEEGVYSFLINPNAFIVAVEGEDRFDAAKNLSENIAEIAACCFAEKMEQVGYSGEVYFLRGGYYGAPMQVLEE